MDKQQQQQLIEQLNDYMSGDTSSRTSRRDRKHETPVFSIHKDTLVILIHSPSWQPVVESIIKDIFPEATPTYVENGGTVGYAHPTADNAHERFPRPAYTIPTAALDTMDYDAAVARLQKRELNGVLNNARQDLKVTQVSASYMGVPSPKETLAQVFSKLAHERTVTPAVMAELAREFLNEHVITPIKDALPAEQQVEFMQSLGAQMGSATARIQPRNHGKTAAKG